VSLLSQSKTIIGDFMKEKSTKYKSQFCELVINVLGYKEGGEWVALALEMDLRGYGETFESALEELIECIRMQISFAEYKEQLDMIFHPAAVEYYLLFSQVRQDRLNSFGKARSIQDDEYRVGGVPAPTAHDIAEYKNKFTRADA
jgi:hypothetical protein